MPIDWQETKKQVSLLGVQWDTVTDEFLFRLPSFKADSRLTKRLILSHVASVYDPYGLISPALLPVKNIQAKIWSSESNAKWDDYLSKESRSEFIRAVSTWENVEFRLPRRSFSSKIGSNRALQLHGFAAASQNGIGFAIYVRIESDFEIEASLLFARSLVVARSKK